MMFESSKSVDSVILTFKLKSVDSVILTFELKLVDSIILTVELKLVDSVILAFGFKSTVVSTSVVVITGLGKDTVFADSTTETRNLDDPLAEVTQVGDDPRDEKTDDEGAEDSVERNVSGTRDTTNRLREGLNIGLAIGEEAGLGAGERRRPPLIRFGSSIDRPDSSFCIEIMDDKEHGNV